MTVRLLVVSAMLVLSGCQPTPVFRIGVEDDPLQRLMATISADMLQRQGARVHRVECGTLRACARSLRVGDLDLLPEFSGSTYTIVRGLDTDSHPHGDLESIRDVTARVNLRWSRGFGFEAPWHVLVTPRLASARALTAIEDLARLQEGIRVAIAPGYAGRPGDGLGALLRRHAVTLARDGVQRIDSPVERIAALLSDAVDVAIVRAPTAALGERGLVRLEDTLDFFPRYEAAVLVGEQAPASVREVNDALQPVLGRLDGREMSNLLEEVTLHGWNPELAVRRMLAGLGIRTGRQPRLQPPELRIAVHPSDATPALEDAAVFMAGQVFPERPVVVRHTVSPFRALERGEALLAVADAARFFSPAQGQRFGRRDERAEAVAVVGTRALHLLTRDSLAAPLLGRIGVQPRASSAGDTALALLENLGVSPTLFAGRERIVEALAAGEIDSAIVLAAIGSPVITRALQDPSIRLAPLVEEVIDPPVFLTEVRVPPRTYPGQFPAVETLGMQAVLAGPAPPRQVTIASGGPASAIGRTGLPLSASEAEALLLASGTDELPDPVLPTVWNRLSERPLPAEQRRAAVQDTVLNVLVFAFLLLALITYLRPDHPPAAGGRDQ